VTGLDVPGPQQPERPEQPLPEEPAADVAGSDTRRLAHHLPDLLRAAHVETVELDVLHRRPSFQGGEVSSLAKSLTDPAREEHRCRGFGFWELVLAQTVTADPETRRGLLKGALRHNSNEAIRVHMDREVFAEQLAAGEFEELPPRDLVAFYSPVCVASDERRLHLPLLDLGVTPSQDGEAAAVDAIECLGLSGLLFESGRSYHFYGAEPVTDRELVAFLARAQLLSPIVDSRWVSHQLIDGRCGLRVSTDSEKTPSPPLLVARIGKLQSPLD
jgi:hypothetical protein